jgi:hypothetical protein
MSNGESRRYWEASHYDSDHDIADTIKIAVTTPATGSYRLGCELGCDTAVLLQWYEGVTISVAGTPMVWRSVIRTDSAEDETHPALIEQGGTYTGGTLIRQRMSAWSYADPSEEPPPFTLKQSTTYLLVATSVADNNKTTLIMRLSKRR